MHCFTNTYEIHVFYLLALKNIPVQVLVIVLPKSFAPLVTTIITKNKVR